MAYTPPAAAIQSPFFNASTTADGLTASPVQTQAGGLLLGALYNRVATVATASDSVTLPPSTTGGQIYVVNAAAANALLVYPAVGDSINALAANASLSVAANKTVEFLCVSAGRWHSILTA